MIRRNYIVMLMCLLNFAMIRICKEALIHLHGRQQIRLPAFIQVLGVLYGVHNHRPYVLPGELSTKTLRPALSHQNLVD